MLAVGVRRMKGVRVRKIFDQLKLLLFVAFFISPIVCFSHSDLSDLIQLIDQEGKQLIIDRSLEENKIFEEMVHIEELNKGAVGWNESEDEMVTRLESDGDPALKIRSHIEGHPESHLEGGLAFEDDSAMSLNESSRLASSKESSEQSSESQPTFKKQ